MRIKDYINTDWRSYADYDNRRSIPHFLDGLKITQRKVLYTATKLPKNDKPLRVSQFASKASELTAYHHGEVSMTDAIVRLVQDFPITNNYPLLEKHGQFGSRLSEDAAASRYIHTKLHKNWDKFFKENDQEILEYNYDDGEQIEPKYFIPIIPMILVNGASGIGNGFKTEILSYSIDDIIRSIKEIISKGKVMTTLTPNINGFTGTITKVDNQTTFTGIIKKINTTTLHITELPPIYNSEKYKERLNKLIDEKIIKDYKNHSTEYKWDWTIECSREIASLDSKILLEKFGLIGRITENFVCWGIDELRPIKFENAETLVEYWYIERLKLYEKSLKHQIAKTKTEIIAADLKIRFVNWCIKNDFRKLTKAEFITKIMSEVKNMTQESANKFVGMPIYKITTDEISLLENEIEELADKLDHLNNRTSLDMMKDSLRLL